MEKLVFADGEKIGVYDGTGVSYYESDYILRYRDYVVNRKRNDEWKISGEGARFRGDTSFYFNNNDDKVTAYINSVDWDGDKIIYAFTVNGSSGVYRKDLSEGAKEEHIFSSSDTEILSVHQNGGLIAVTVRSDDVTSHIGTLDARNSELRTLTGGDARDSNVHFSSTNNEELIFDSAGVGRSADGGFTGKFAPAVIMKLNRDTLELTEIKADGKFSYVNPKQNAKGEIYCIRKPNREKSSGNFFLDVLLFPWRIIEAIIMFIQMFVFAFTGKSMTSNGANPAKGRDTDSKKLFVDGNLIEAEKEYKRNRKFKDREYGFIPASWKLIKLGSQDKEDEIIESGVCDFAIAGDGAVYFTDGAHVYRKFEGKTKKIANTECCLSLSLTHSAGTVPAKEEDFFA